MTQQKKGNQLNHNKSEQELEQKETNPKTDPLNVGPKGFFIVLLMILAGFLLGQFLF